MTTTAVLVRSAVEQLDPNLRADEPAFLAAAVLLAFATTTHKSAVAIARALGLRKLMAQMTSDQKGAIATFERLGFQMEALLQDFVIDRSDRTRDLIVMAYDVTGLTEHVD